MARLKLEQRQKVWSYLDYKPSPEQLSAHETDSMHILVVGGIGAGKSAATAMELLPHTLKTRFMSKGLRKQYVDPLYWLVGPEYEDCRPEFVFLWDALQELELRLEQKLIKKVSFPDEGPCSLQLATGARIETRSGAKPAECMKGRGPQGIIYCEMGRISKDLWDRGRARLSRSEEPGVPGWSWGSGVLEDSLPWFLEHFEIGQTPNEFGLDSIRMPSWSNRVTYPGGRDDPQIKYLEKTLEQAEFDERIAAKIAPPSDVVFPQFSHERHVGDYGFMKWMKDDRGKMAERPVALAIDPGYDPGAYAVLALQELNGVIRVFDEIYKKRTEVHEVIEEARERPWWNHVRHAVIDPFGGVQHQAMASQAEEWKRLGNIPVHAPSRAGLDILAGIRRFRTFLAPGQRRNPMIVFDSKCAKTLKEFRMYRRSPSREGRQLKVNPIDNNNHSIKALIYYVVATRGLAGIERASGVTSFEMVA